MLTAYQPSGRIGGLLIPLAAPLLAAAAVLGAAIATGHHFSPFIMLDVFLSLVLAGGLYMLVNRAMRLGRCRSGTLAALLGVFAAAAALAAAHAAAYWWTVRALPAGTAPPFWDYVQARLQAGWNLGRRGSAMHITGLGVWIVWGVEAAIALIAGPLGGRAAAREPYCEACDRWADEVAHEFEIPGLSDATITRMRTATDLETVLTPPLEEIQAAPRTLAYKVQACPQCGNVAFLDLAVKTTSLNKDGKPETTTHSLGRTVVLTPEEAAAVGQLKADVIEVTTRGEAV